MGWKVQVAGAERELSILAEVLDSDTLRLSKDQDNQWFLTGDALDKAGSTDEVKTKGIELVSHLNGSLTLLTGSCEPLKANGATFVRADGRRDCYVWVEGIEVKASVGFPTVTVTRADGTIEKSHPCDPVIPWTFLATKDQSAAKVLRLLISPLDWVNLYRIFEIIEADLGGRQQLVATGWITGNQRELFRRTACSPAVTGDAARHGVQTESPPANPMELCNAISLIQNIAKNWLSYKASKP